eukprot:s1512_g12.t1
MRQTREAGKEKQEGMRMVPMTLVHMPMKSSKARAWHANCEQGFEESGSCTRQILQIALGSSFPAGVL